MEVTPFEYMIRSQTYARAHHVHFRARIHPPAGHIRTVLITNGNSMYDMGARAHITHTHTHNPYTHTPVTKVHFRARIHPPLLGIYARY